MKYFRPLLILLMIFAIQLPAWSEAFYWIKSTGDLNGNVLQMTKKSDGTILAAAYSKGVYRSKDGGKSWVVLNKTLEKLDVYSIALRNDNEIYIGCEGGVQLSTDDGENWAPKGNGLGDPFVNMIAVKPSGELFASTLYDGLYRSTNKGDNWTPINNGLGSPSVNTICFSKENNDIFLGTYSGVFFSRDLGVSWRALNNGLPSGSNNIYTIQMYKKNCLIIGTSRGSIYRTTNNGGSWSPIFDLKDSSQVYSLIAKSENEFFAGIYGKGVFHSVDTGATWTEINEGLYNEDVLCLMMTGAKNEIFAGTWGSGIFRGSDDILTTDFAGGEFCAGSEIVVPFVSVITFDSTNFFTVQLSDSNGSFINPVNLDRIFGQGSGSIKTVIPKNTKAGSHYRVRVIGHRPSLTGQDNGADIIIKELPPLLISGQLIVCPNLEYPYKAIVSPDIETKWSAIGGKIIGDNTGETVRILWDSVGKGRVKLVQKSLITGCIDSTIEIVSVRFADRPRISRQDTTLVSNSDYGNQWFLNGKKIDGATNKVYIPLVTGNYSLQVTDSSGCVSPMSAQYYYNVESVIENIIGSGLFEISPIPASDFLNIRLMTGFDNLKSIQIYTLPGEKAAEFNDFGSENDVLRLDVSHLSNGTYMIIINTQAAKYFEKFVISR